MTQVQINAITNNSLSIIDNAEKLEKINGEIIGNSVNDVLESAVSKINEAVLEMMEGLKKEVKNSDFIQDEIQNTIDYQSM